MTRRPETSPGDGAQGSGRMQLLALAAVFLGPVVIAAVLYASGAQQWLESGKGHHGQLIQPPRALDSFPLRGGDGDPLGTEYLLGKWTLVYVGPSACPEDCRGALEKMRQVHKAQGRNIGRVQRLYVAEGGLPGEGTRELLDREHPHLTVAVPGPEGAGMTPFEAEKGGNVEGIYILDPNANLIMRYDPGTEGDGILDDLEHLLKHSAIG